MSGGVGDARPQPAEQARRRQDRAGSPVTEPSFYRLFAAITPPPEALAELGAVVDGLAACTARARLAARDRWHITLVFLGDVPIDRVDAAVEALTVGAASARPSRLRLAGGGRFGRGPSTIMWAGVTGATPNDLVLLRALVRSVRRQLRRRRLPCDDTKQYRPHITLARPGAKLDAAAITADIATLRTYSGTPFDVTEATLYRSQLGPQPEYTELATAPLGD